MQLSIGAIKSVAPARLAPINLSSIPPIGPTSPFLLMVPVPAIKRPFTSCARSNFSIIPRAKIKPPLGPPVFGKSNFTSRLVKSPERKDCASAGSYLFK